MHKVSLGERKIRWLLALALASSSGCAGSLCIYEPELADCKPVTMVLLAERGQAYRHQEGVTVFSFNGLNLNAKNLLTTVNLQSDEVATLPDGSANRWVTENPTIQQDQVGSLSLGLNRVSAHGGFFTLTANRIGSESPPDQSRPQPVLLYTPPNLAASESLVAQVTYPAETKRSPVAVMMQPAARGSAGSGLFVTEQDATLFVTALSRYTYDAAGNKLVLDSAFNQAVIFDGPDEFLGRFALSAKSALIYQYRQLAPTGHFLTPLDLAAPYMKKPSQQMDDQPLAQRNIRLLAADPDTTTRLVATDTKLTAFTFDYGDPVYRSGPSFVLPRRLRYLTARHYDLKDPRIPTEQISFDAVSIDENNEIQFYDLGASSLTVDSALSAAANQAVAAGLDNNVVVGLAVADIDQDGYPDLVLALQDAATKQTTEIGWLRYVGQGLFAPLNGNTRAKLAGSPLLDVRSLAVGDVNSDGWLDVALANPNSLQVYLNRAQ